jgi:hypothetical protein
MTGWWIKIKSSDCPNIQFAGMCKINNQHCTQSACPLAPKPMSEEEAENLLESICDAAQKLERISHEEDQSEYDAAEEELDLLYGKAIAALTDSSTVQGRSTEPH